MRSITNHALSGLLALALSIAVVPATADAQEQETEAEQACAAELSPQAVEAGQAAVLVKATLSTSVGEVEEIRAPEGSGLALATPGDIPRTDLAREGEEGEEPEPIETASGEKPGAAVWFNTANAEAGSHEVVLVGADGECTGTLTVSEKPETEQPGS